jgi:hypothetical protein
MKRDEDIFIRFYIKIERNICRITIKKVKLKATRIEHKSHINKQDDIVDKHSEVVSERFIEGYWIIAQNRDNPD